MLVKQHMINLASINHSAFDIEIQCFILHCCDQHVITKAFPSPIGDPTPSGNSLHFSKNCEDLLNHNCSFLKKLLLQKKVSEVPCTSSDHIVDYSSQQRSTL